MNGALYDSEATLGPSDISASDTDTESCMSSRSADKNKKRKQKRKAAKVAAKAAASAETATGGPPVRPTVLPWRPTTLRRPPARP